MDFYRKPEKSSSSFSTGSSYSGRSWDRDSRSEWGSWWKDRKSAKKKYSSRLGFNSGYSYSHYSYYKSNEDEKSDIDKITNILRKAYNNSRDLVNILDFPFSLNIYFNNNEEQTENKILGIKNNFRKIYVPTNSINSSESEEEIINIISGAALHEASHLMFTNASQMKKIFGNPIRKMDNSITCSGGLLYKKLNGSTSTLHSVRMDELATNLTYRIFTFIEDERVDTELLEERNGFGDYVESNKNFLYKEVSNILEQEIKDEKNTNSIKFILSLIQLLRFPDKFDSEIEFVKDNPELFSRVSFIMDKYKPSSTLGSCIQSIKFLELILEVITNEDDLKKLEEILKNKTEDDTYTETNFKDLDIKDISSLMKNDLLSKLQDINGFSGVTKVFEKLDPTVNYGEDLDLSESCKLPSNKKNISERNSLIARGIYEVVKDTFFIKVGGDEHDKKRYIKDMERIKDKIPSMKNLVRNTNKNFEFIIPSQRNGKLDTTKLVEAYQGVPHVYNKMGKVTTSGAHICVVIDESGSMDWNYRIENARIASILMNEAFGNIPGIQLYIYGHTADDIYERNTTIHIYREPGFKTLYPGIGLSQIKAVSENRDGQAYRDIANRVRSFTNQPVIMFILSDGDPSAQHYRYEKAIEDTINAIKEIEGKGFNLVQVILNQDDIEEDLINSFKSHINVSNDIGKLPSLLAGETRKILLKILQDNQNTVTY